jgi:alpha-tubulin suppressor-like RCC1 family protein
LRVKSIDANYMRTCAIFTDGRLKCFGYNRYGGAGAGLTDQTLGATASELGDALPFVDLGTDRYAVKVSVGTEHTCAILDNGSVKCWGRNDVGQLGLDDTTDRGATAASMGDALNTVNLGSGRKAIDISAGTDHTCALLDNATIKCWGSNTSGQLGIGTSTVAVGDSTGDMAALSAVSLGLSAVPIKVSVGGSSSCAILAGGSLKCWGENGTGQLGIGSTTDVGTTSSQMGNNLAAIDLGTGEVAIDVSIALNTACAVVQDSGIKCWGSNTAGQLGIGSTSSV